MGYFSMWCSVTSRTSCGYLKRWLGYIFNIQFCSSITTTLTYSVCEQRIRPAITREPLAQNCSSGTISKLFNVTPQVHVICPRNHAALNFLVYDQNTACCSTNDVSFGSSRESWALPTGRLCDADVTSLPPSFSCATGGQRVPYTLVCDYRQDCQDNTDENFCVFPDCNGTHQFQCRSKQCLAYYEQCNNIVDCLDKTDEEYCVKSFKSDGSTCTSAVISIDGRGGFSYTERDRTTPCPDTHFKCLSIEYCMPVFVRCNGVNDCPEKEDEEGCDDTRTCPGFYRCRGFLNTFLHPDHLCDGWAQCPQHDDERFCNLTCPAQCSCLGHSWFCRQIFQASMYPLIRFLDAENSGMKPSGLTQNKLLIHLSLSKCSIAAVDPLSLPNLVSLDLEGNLIGAVTESDFSRLPNLNTLFLTGNPLTSAFTAVTKLNDTFSKLIRLDLSEVKIRSVSSSLLDSFPNLQILNLSGRGVETMTAETFHSVPKLHVLDVRGVRFDSFSLEMLKPLTRLRVVRASNFKVCCPAALPDSFHSVHCESPEDVVASCTDLFKSSLHRVSWNVATSMALVCNVAILVKRLKGKLTMSSSLRPREKPGVDVFVTGVFVSGCIHSFYLAIISLADASYRGSYISQDTAWRQGPFCAAAGFLWLLSSEISLFLVGLITLDRVLVSWRPRTSSRFSEKSAVAVISVLVTVCVIIALSPQLRWQLFQLTALCTPLLLANQDFPGGHYLFGVVSVFNGLISWLVGLGQLSVYVFLRRKTFAFIQSPNEIKELSRSRRMMAVVLCDVIYWIVISHSSYFVANGMTLSDDVAVLAQVLLMPFNCTLKPVLHVVVILLEHRRQGQEERMRKILIAKRHN